MNDFPDPQENLKLRVLQKPGKYQRIYADLVADIENAHLDKGDRIASETELMAQYDASRGTVRKAVELLQERGYVQKMHGKGVFVTRPAHIEFHLGGIVSFREVYEQLGSRVQTQIETFRMIRAEGHIAKVLQVPKGTPLLHLKRIRKVDNERVILDVNYFVQSLVPGLTRAIAEDSIYHYIEHVLNYEISYAERVIEAQPCSEDDKALLDLNGMDHLIVVKNTTHYYDGRVFEYTESRHRLDKFFFSDIARRQRK